MFAIFLHPPADICVKDGCFLYYFCSAAGLLHFLLSVFQRFLSVVLVLPVRVGICDVNAGQGDNGQAGGSGVGHRVIFWRERPDPVPLLFCLSPWQRRQLQVAREPPVDDTQLYPQGAAWAQRRLFTVLGVQRGTQEDNRSVMLKMRKQP